MSEIIPVLYFFIITNPLEFVLSNRIMRHPFIFIPRDKRSGVFWTFLISTLLLIVILSRVGVPLITQAAPFGIVSFELAGTLEKATQILLSWNQLAQVRAGFSLGFDYLYMISYSVAIALACLWSMEVLSTREWPLAGIGKWAGWGLLAAALLDAIENIGLVLLLFGSRNPNLPPLAWICAVLKFILVFLGLVFALFGFAVRLVIHEPQPDNQLQDKQLS